MFITCQRAAFDIAFTVFGKHCECIAQKCTHLERLPPLVSHLLLLWHCVLTWYGGQKKNNDNKKLLKPGLEQGTKKIHVNVSAACAMGTIVFNGPCHTVVEMPINFNFKSQLFVENGKIQLMPKIMNHLFTCYLNCVCKSNPVCLIQQLPLIILLASYVQWLYFLIWPGKIDPFTFPHLCEVKIAFIIARKEIM